MEVGWHVEKAFAQRPQLSGALFCCRSKENKDSEYSFKEKLHMLHEIIYEIFRILWIISKFVLRKTNTNLHIDCH